MATAAPIEEIRDALMRALAVIEGDPAMRDAFDADPRAQLVAAGVPLTEEGEIEVDVGRDGKIFIGIPIDPASATDVEPPALSGDRAHHADCA